jgi:hypothetical protein
MIKHLVRGVAILLLAIACALPAAAQTPPDPAATLTPPTAAEKPERPLSAPGLVLTFLSTVLVLFIICKPSRKT